MVIRTVKPHLRTRSTAPGSLREPRSSPYRALSPIAVAASRIGYGLPLGQVLCPSSPTLGQLRNRKQPRNLVAIARIDAKDIPDGEVVIRPFQDPDLVSGAHIALDDDPEVGTGSQRLAEAARKGLVVHPDSEPPTRDSRLGNLEKGAPDLPALADERVVELDPFGGQVLSELAVRERTPDLPFPPALVLHRVGIDSLVESAVCLQIRLLVAREIDAPSGDPSAHRRLPDRALGGAAVIIELAHATEVDRTDSCGFTCHRFSSSEHSSRPRW